MTFIDPESTRRLPRQGSHRRGIFPRRSRSAPGSTAAQKTWSTRLLGASPCFPERRAGITPKKGAHPAGYVVDRPHYGEHEDVVDHLEAPQGDEPPHDWEAGLGGDVGRVVRDGADLGEQSEWVEMTTPEVSATGGSRGMMSSWCIMPSQGGNPAVAHEYAVNVCKARSARIESNIRR